MDANFSAGLFSRHKLKAPDIAAGGLLFLRAWGYFYEFRTNPGRNDPHPQTSGGAQR